MAVTAPSDGSCKALRHALCAATLLATLLIGCANEDAFIVADHARCRELGFHPNTRDYDACLTELQRRRVTLSSPEPLRE
jgi:hypothetical protein